MPNAIVPDESLSRLSNVLSDQGPKLILAAVLSVAGGLLLVPASYQILPFAAGGALASLAVLGRGANRLQTWRWRRATRDVAALCAQDPAFCFVTDAEGEVRFMNAAAVGRFGAADGGTLANALGDLFANPAGVLHRLQEKAAALGGTREDVVTRNGHVRLTVTALPDGASLWRLDEVMRSLSPSAVDATRLPVLVANSAGSVLQMNEAMRELAGGSVRHVDRILAEMPNGAGLVDVATADGLRKMSVVRFSGDDDREEIYLLPAEALSVVRGEDTAAIEELPIGVLQLQADGSVASANRLARDLLGPAASEDLLGSSLSDVLEGLGRSVRDWLEDAAHGRGLGKPEVLRVSSDKTETFLQVTLGRLNVGGEMRLVAALSDATELKTLEAQFVQSQKMQAIGQLAGGVAHDFNNLLTAISGHCDLMLLRHDQGDPDYGDLIQIHQNANRAASLVGQLLAFSRKQTLQPEVIDLRDTLGELTHLLNRLVGERIVLRLQHDAGLPTIRADKRQLEQVIMNLVVNARDAMPDGGEIRIQTATRVLSDQMQRDRAKVPPGRYVVVKVEDQGSGIPADKVGKIFEPFFTTKRTGEGTGLGLSTAYGIVKQSGGFIFVDSVPGNGTVFTLFLPAHDGAAEAPAQSRPATRKTAATSTAPVVWRSSSARMRRVARGGAAVAEVPEDEDVVEVSATLATGGPVESPAAPAQLQAEIDAGSTPQPPEAVTAGQVQSAPLPQQPAVGDRAPAQHGSSEGVILLVEDEAPVRAFASRALRMRGYTVVEAECAEEALSTLEDPNLQIDLFVTDVIMPGMDGPTWVRRALDARPGVKVVFMSGYAEDSFGEEQAKIPNSIFLPKPFSLSELTATVQDQLH